MLVSTLFIIAPSESFHTPGSIHYPLLTGKKWVTFTAQLNPHLLPGRANSKNIATGTGNLGIRIILRMNVIFHTI
jgi:hypothetical protein